MFRVYFNLNLYFLNLAGRGFASRGLTRFWPAGLGLKRAGRAGPGPDLGQTLTGLGLNSRARAWAGLGLTNFCGPGPGLDSKF